VEQPDLRVGDYGWNNRGRTVLRHSAPFAVVRWTNLYFPVRGGLLGDWFGGRLRPLFGNGIVDTAVLGNQPGRLLPGIAHRRYLGYPDDLSQSDVASLLPEAELEPLLANPS